MCIHLYCKCLFVYSLILGTRSTQYLEQDQLSLTLALEFCLVKGKYEQYIFAYGQDLFAFNSIYQYCQLYKEKNMRHTTGVKDC